MKKVKLVYIVVVFFLFCLAGYGIIFHYIIKKDDTNVVLKMNNLRVILRAASHIDKLWREGDPKCNSGFLDNQLNDGFKINYEGDDYKILVKKQKYGRNYSVVTRANKSGVKVPIYAVMVDIYLKDHIDDSLMIFLEDSCNDVYLPLRIYGFGKYDKRSNKKKKKQDWRWDNFFKNIYVDKYQVSFRDVQEWFDYDQVGIKIKRAIKFPADKSMWSAPVTGLDLLAMRDYCAFRGKQLLTAHVYDAMTFMPVDYTDSSPLRVFRGPYPWSTKKKDSFLFKARNDKKFVFKKSYCKNVYTRECNRLGSILKYKENSVSWTGMFQILGGSLEFVRNPLEPYKNLKASSLYFAARSPWHHLGVRAHWDGIGFDSSHFDWRLGGDEYPPKKYSQKKNKNKNVEIDFYNVGFRCMRYVYVEN